MLSKIDVKIRHVTPPGANLFLELGFVRDEAERLYAVSQKRISEIRRRADKPSQPDSAS